MERQDLKHISWRLSQGVAVVRLRFAQLRRYEAYDEMAEELRSVADAESVKAVLLNFDAIDHLTSRMLGIMTVLSKKLSAEARTLAVCRMRQQPLRAFRVCGLDSIIPVYPTEEEARAALRAACITREGAKDDRGK